MAYVMLAPLLPLVASGGGGAEGLIISVITFLGIGALLNKLHKKGSYVKNKATFQVGSLLVIALAVYFGGVFYLRWYQSDTVAAVAGRLGLSAKVLVGVLAVLLSGAAAWSMNWLLCDIQKIFSGTEYLPDLNRRLAQPDRGAVKLDRDDWLMCALLALANAVIFCDTCPLFKIRPKTDSSVFLYIGREMLRGKIPYVDLFDHKGVLLYFIECAGEWLSLPGTYSGVWLIELAGLFMTAVFLYKTVRLLTDSKNVGYLVVLIVMLPCAGMYYQGGNTSESYALPFIAMAVYIYLKFFMTACYRPAEIAALGAGCAAVAFLRMNMVGVWIAFTPLVLFFLLKECQYKELIQCSGCFIGGFAAVCIPIGVYCLLTGSMNSMITYSIQFNMQYTGSKGSVANQIKAALLLMPGFCLIPIILAFVFYKQGGFSHKAKVFFWIHMWGFAVSLFLAAISGRGYFHYGVVLIPLLAVPVWLTVQSVANGLRKTAADGESNNSSGFGKNLNRAIAVTVCLTVLLISVPKVLTAANGKADPVVEYLTKETDENDDVLIIGNACYYYLESGRRTDNKFFNQFPAVNASDALYNEFIEEITHHLSDVVLFSIKEERLEAIYERWCEEGKYAREAVGPYTVYRLQDV